METHGAAGDREGGFGPKGHQSGHGGARRRTLRTASRRPRIPELTHPRCVFQLLKKHFQRYTPEFVAETCGCSVEDFLFVCESLVAELGTRADERVRLLRRLDAAHGRRAVHPRRRDHPAAARQHGPAGRRHRRAARPRVDPGLDRHPDALRHAARLSADAACGGLRRLRQLRRRRTRRRAAGGATSRRTG